MTEEQRQEKIKAAVRLRRNVPKVINLGQEILQMIEDEERRDRRRWWAFLIALGTGTLGWLIYIVLKAWPSIRAMM